MLKADRLLDNIVTAFVPGGMTAAAGGLCGAGDYSLQGAASTDENQADWVVDANTGLPSGLSYAGGFQLGGSPVPAAAMVPDTVFQFCVPSLGMAATDPAATDPSGTADGLSGLNPSVSSGTTKLSYRSYDGAGVGSLMFSASCLLPKIPAPGLPILGGKVMLNLTDPTVFSTLRHSPVLLVANGGAPFDNGIAQSSTIGPVPASAVGLELKSQSYRLKLPAFELTSSPMTQMTFRP
jgi:hypothetical protein